MNSLYIICEIFCNFKKNQNEYYYIYDEGTSQPLLSKKYYHKTTNKKKKPNSHLDIDDIFKIIGKRLIGGGGGMIPI